MYAQCVTIGPEFFAKSFHDYRDKFWAFAREILQNSLDCGSTAIAITSIEAPDGSSTVVVVENDGEPMTREILVGKLLSLGASGKDFQNTVGGFGKAKEILYFAHQSYTIASGEWWVAGSGAGYDIEPAPVPVEGTISTVTWTGRVAEKLRAQFRRFIALCDRRHCRFTLDGAALKPEIPRFRVLRPLVHEDKEWAHLGLHSYEENLLLVRIGGIPMFFEQSDFKRTLVLELQGTSGERFTANRDGLRYPYSTNLRNLITQMAVDRRSALKREEPVYTRFAGPKLRRPEETDTTAPSEAPSDPGLTAARAATQDAGGGICVVVRGRTEAPVPLGHEFIVKNCLRRRVPRAFDPQDPRFSDHARWLIRAWSGCLVELHALHENDSRFATGFVLSVDVEAEFEKSPAYERVYFLNPCRPGKTSLLRRWKKTDRGAIAATAAHEYVHGGMGLSNHGEDFANKLTDVMGTMLTNWRRFARHFQ
jgi:hypothetical protein